MLQKLWVSFLLVICFLTIRVFWIFFKTIYQYFTHQLINTSLTRELNIRCREASVFFLLDLLMIIPFSLLNLVPLKVLPLFFFILLFKVDFILIKRYLIEPFLDEKLIHIF